MSLRRHVFTILVVCVALAGGIALGSGPLRGGDDNPKSGSGAADQALQHQVDALKANSDLEQQLLTGLAPGMVKGRLTNELVSLIVLPGVDQATVDNLATLVSAAGGQVANVVTLLPQVIDAGKKTYIESVADGSIRGQPDLAGARELPAYDKLAAVLARAYVGKAGAKADPESVDIDAELAGAELVTLESPLARRGNVALILTTGDHDDSNRTQAEHIISVSLVKGLAAGSEGVLVASGTGGTEPGGLIADLLAADGADAVATIDAADSPAGRIAAIYALAGVAEGKPEHFQTTGDDPQLPAGLPLPTP